MPHRLYAELKGEGYWVVLGGVVVIGEDVYCTNGRIVEVYDGGTEWMDCGPYVDHGQMRLRVHDRLLTETTFLGYVSGLFCAAGIVRHDQARDTPFAEVEAYHNLYLQKGQPPLAIKVAQVVHYAASAAKPDVPVAKVANKAYACDGCDARRLFTVCATCTKALCWCPGGCPTCKCGREAPVQT